MITEQELKQGMLDIPPLSPVIVDVLNLLNSNEDINYPLLESKIIQEPGLIGRVLGLANSSFFGMPSEVSSIKEACFILGINAIRNLVIASAVIEKFPSDSGTNLDIAGLWKHSVGTASAAKVMARHAKMDQELAFTAGLLHDIGKMILDTHFTKHYVEVLSYQTQHDCFISEAEQAVLGIDHSEVGAMITERWNLPSQISDSIRLHHSANTQNKPGFSHVINLGDILSRGLGIGNAGDPFVPALSEKILDILRIEINDIKESLAEIETMAEHFIPLLD